MDYELADKVDQQLKKTERENLFRIFHKITIISGWILKFICFSLVPLVIKLCAFYMVDYFEAKITLLALGLNIVLTMAVNVYASQIMPSVFIIMPYHYLVLKVFDCQLTRCLWFIQNASVFLSQTFLNRFMVNYIHLHRHLQLYNTTLCNHIMMHDSILKMAGVIAAIFYLKQKEQLNIFSYLILMICMSNYIIYLIVHSRLAQFPDKNLICYKKVASLSANHQRKIQARKLRNKISKNNNNRMSRQQTNSNNLPLLVNIVNRERIRHLLRIDLVSNFLSNNRFGFTNGQSGIINRIKMLQNFATNFYMIALFYKKLAV